MAVGPKTGYHRDLVADLGIERAQIKSPGTDMGLLIKETDSIVVTGRSAGYRWPPEDDPEMAEATRKETVRQLQESYPDLEVRSL